jgi:hypothetical protein
MAEIIRTINQEFYVSNAVYAEVTSTLLPIYGSVEKANNYFSSRLNCQKWNNFDNTKKFVALVEGTRYVEKLNYSGVKASDTQALQFPRGTDTLVPVNIEYACYEIAYALLKGVNPTTERENLFVKVQGYGQFRTEYRNDTVMPWIAAGIPSLEAWEYLLPYILPRLELDLLRSN